MAYADFLPARESDLLEWTANFSLKINTMAAALGLTPLQAASYQAVNDSFAQAYRTAIDPVTRTPTAIVVKNTIKTELVELARSFAAIIQSHPETTDPQRVSLGLTVRRRDGVSIGRPPGKPELTMLSTTGRRAKLKVFAIDEHRRAKPDGVAGAMVLAHVGEEPPLEPWDWCYCCTTTRQEFEVSFPPRIAPGAKVWLTAMWFNRKGQSGPAATPVSTRIGDSMAKVLSVA